MYPSPADRSHTGTTVSALGKGDDLIVTCETAPDRDRKRFHVMTGKLVSGSLKARIEAYPEDGGVIVSGKWTLAQGYCQALSRIAGISFSTGRVCSGAHGRT